MPFGLGPELYDASDEEARAALEDAAIVDAAHAYLEARRKNEAAEPVDWERARAEVDRTYRDLLVACGYDE